MEVVSDAFRPAGRRSLIGSHLWLVPIGVLHHAPVRPVVAVAEAEPLHEDLVLPVLPTLDDETFDQLLLAQVHLQPLPGEGLRLRQQGPPRPAGEQTGVLRHPAPVGVRRRGDLVVSDQA